MLSGDDVHIKMKNYGEKSETAMNQLNFNSIIIILNVSHRT